MARFCTLFSGSSGNCTYIGSGSGGILIDVGVSAKKINLALEQIGVDRSEIKAIFITHEHSDHISGLKTISKNWDIPIYASAATAASLESSDKICPTTNINIIDETAIDINNMVVSRFTTLHDCAGSSGYTITLPDGTKSVVCTDLGIVTDEVRTALTGCNIVMLESNHDVNMLENGPYPYVLKRRILGDNGHLSNASCAIELPSLVNNGTTRIVLAHLSRENNHPEIVRVTARASLIDNGMVEDSDYLLNIASPFGNKMIIY